MKKHLLSAIGMILFLAGSYAQDIKLSASAKSAVSIGDRFQLTYSVNKRGGQFTGPKISDFRILSGPNISTSQSYQVINGKMSQSVSVSYIYYLQAFKEGSFEIPPASVDFDGEVVSSGALKIEVLPGNTPQTVPKNAGGANQQEQQDISADTGEDIFLRAYISKSNPYQGEQVIVTYKIYTANIPISDIEIEKLASFPGFWSTNLTGDRQQIEPVTEVINGKEYLSGVLYKAALFPQKSGRITISPKKLNCTAQIRTQGSRRVRDPFFDSFFDDPFFNNQYRNVRVEMESNPLVLDVKPLPVDMKPAGYGGAVGRFDINASVDEQELAVNDAVTLKLVISGSGNLELINTPDINWPPDFETYEPKISKNIRTSPSGVTGNRTFEFLAIPRSAGEFTIGPVELSYFDPGAGIYRKKTTESFRIKVEKGDQPAASVTYSGVAQEDIMYLGQDIRYLKTYGHDLRMKDHYLITSPLYYILLAAPLAVLALASILILSSRKRRRNTVMVRNRKATRVARKNLRVAKGFLRSQQDQAFYAEISRALWGYLSDKFNIPPSDLSMDTVRERLNEKQVSNDSIDEFLGVLNKCEFARFAPGERANLMNEIYQEAIMFISRIESELKS